MRSLRRGQDATKAAVRACRNAIEFNSIPSIRAIVPGGYDAMKLHIQIGAPEGAEINLDKATTGPPLTITFLREPSCSLLSSVLSSLRPPPPRCQKIRLREPRVCLSWLKRASRLELNTHTKKKIQLNGTRFPCDEVRAVFPYGNIVDPVEVSVGGLLARSGIAIPEMGDKNDDFVICVASITVGY